MSIVSKTSKRNIILFSFYDIANTVYSQIIQSTIILRLIQIIGQKENGMTYDSATFFFTIGQALSQILVLAIIPLIGAIADRIGRRKPLVISITGVTLISTSLLWIHKNIYTAMTLFVIANLAYWAALAVYDAMIPALAAEEDIGKTSGIAMGLGWVSIIPSIVLTIVLNALIGKGIDPNADPNKGPVVYDYYGSPWTYIATAGLFILFMIPFFFAKEKTRPGKLPPAKVIISDAFGQLYRTFRDIKQHKEAFKFIIGYFFIADVANTANIVLLNVLRDAIGFEESQALYLELPVVFLAIIVIPIIGWLGDKFGPKTTVWAVGGLFAEGLAAGITAIWFGNKSISMSWNILTFLTILMMVCAGIGLGSTWVVQRVMILKLSPPDKVGEFVGFSYISGRLNAALAIFIWGLIFKIFYPIFDKAGHDYRTYSICLLSLVVMLAIGLTIIYFVRVPRDEERKKWAKEYLENGMKTQTEKEKEREQQKERDDQ